MSKLSKKIQKDLNGLSKLPISGKVNLEYELGLPDMPFAEFDKYCNDLLDSIQGFEKDRHIFFIGNLAVYVILNN